jgi:O-antigen ligase
MPHRLMAIETGIRTETAGATSEHRHEIIERALLWSLIAGLAWVPFRYGSNDLLAWGINAIVFPGLAAAYEVSLLVRRKVHPVGLAHLALPAGLFAAVVLFVVVQNISPLPAPLPQPIWGMAAATLDRAVAGSISVDRDLTSLALLRLLTAASVFWLTVQLCRDGARANLLIGSVAAIGCLYAAYGLAAFSLGADGASRVVASGGRVTSTFVNHNSLATYAGIALVAIGGLLLRLYGQAPSGSGVPVGMRLATLIEITGRTGALLVGGAFLLVVALLLTGSRGGIAATAIGLVALAVLTSMRGRKRGSAPLQIIGGAVVLLALVLLAFGDIFIGILVERGVGDTDRLAVYLITLRSILDAPLSGWGYGTFADVFPLYRDRSISVQSAWEQAHNTYLEVFQGLGLVFGALLVGCVVLVVLACVKGAVTRRGNATAPRVAASAACLVGVHALVDFSLQIQAVALTFMALLAAGFAQSHSSRRNLAD